MSFVNTKVSHRIIFDLSVNMFIATDIQNEKCFAYGVTVEDAIKKLKQSNTKKGSS